MSEQLNQQGKNAFIEINNYKIYVDTGATTLNQLKKIGIIEEQDFGTHGNRKPDRIILKTEGKRKSLFIIGENKDIKKFENIYQQQEALNQAIEVAELFAKKPPIVYCTDGSLYIYAVLKKELDSKIKKYKIVKTEDNYYFTEPLNFEHGNINLNEQSIQLIERIVNNTNDEGNFIKEIEVNPTNLAKKVAQSTWVSKKSKAEHSLSLFIEVFVLKYLSDLGILNTTTHNNGSEINFQSILDKKNEALPYYFTNARPFIKTIFPTSELDPMFYSTTIINGMPLNPNVDNDKDLFYRILKNFNDFGKLNNINKEFKTRLFEDFLKNTQTIAERGQYFTPRKVVQAIVEMADLHSYKGEKVKICDPSCGVGGFILEALNKVKSKINFNEKDRFEFKGYDIVEEIPNSESADKTVSVHALTGVLSKANCLIYLTDKFTKNTQLKNGLSKFINNTFYSYRDTTLGSLSEIKHAEYDLILTNPPYVVSGSKEIKKILEKKQLGYKGYGSGIESLFVEKIIYELKEHGKAFIILPEGIFNRSAGGKSLRDFIYNNCYIESIIALPLNTFYTTTKKTCILVIKKMSVEDKLKIKNRKTLIYDVKSIGESLDKNRFDQYDNNDLQKASVFYKQFISIVNNIDEDSQIDKCEKSFDNFFRESNDKKLKLVDESTLLNLENWIFKFDNDVVDNEQPSDVINKLELISMDLINLISVLKGD